MDNITFISAGAGSGKTYRLTQELGQLLSDSENKYRPEGVIATTFTKLAASELRGRVRQRLIETGKNALAIAIDQALIGTVNSVCGQLLKRFAFEAGLSPVQTVIDEQGADHLFSMALESVLSVEKVDEMNQLAKSLSIDNWQTEVKKIVQTARSNNLQPEEFSVFREYSIKSYFEYLPQASKRNLTQELLNAIEKALAVIDRNIDNTKKTQDYCSILYDCKQKLKNNRNIWSDWIKLIDGPAKKSWEHTEALIDVAKDVEKNCDFQSDIKNYIGNLFDIAKQSLEAFQQLKKQKGMIDFVDQEQLLYKVLDNPDVASVMEEELDLLMVDEFQDTSPIQLALFLKLSKLAKKVVWVGDIKQAIYGFRGSDPELMIGIVEQLEQQGGTVDVLEKSWRSCPDLVNYVNEIFVPAFSNTLEAERVKLIPEFKETKKIPSVAYWQLTGSNTKKRGHNIAQGIKQLIDSGYIITDRHKNTSRTIHYGDITILARANDTLNELAVILDEWGIPVARKTAGLLSTPEAALILSGLRFMLAPGKDSLSATELYVLSTCKEPEQWLNERLLFVQKEGYQERDWCRDSDLIKVLEEQAQRLNFMSPSEALSIVVNKINAHKLVLQWSGSKNAARQRIQNLNRLEQMAVEYEQLCKTSKIPATVSGMLLWFNDQKNEELDLIADANNEEAVKLLTHHAAKGLEWPVVIAMDLHKEIRSRIWGLKAINDGGITDVTDPLKNRFLRYWPWVFGKRSKNILLKERLETSEIGIQEKNNAIEEDKRLMYVSFTRPSELLILPMKNKKGEWLESVGAIEWMLPDGETLQLPNNSGTIVSEFLVCDAEEVQEETTTSREPLYWFQDVLQHTEKLPAFISPSAQPADNTAKISQVIELGERIPIQKVTDMAQFGTALHALIAVNLLSNNTVNNNVIDNLLIAHKVEDCISREDAVLVAVRFREFTEGLKAKKIHVEYPIEYYMSNGQCVTGWIDTLIETEHGYIIIDHKSSPKSRDNASKDALKYSGQLKLYKEAIEKITGKQVISTWIHFAIMGLVIKVE